MTVETFVILLSIMFFILVIYIIYAEALKRKITALEDNKKFKRKIMTLYYKQRCVHARYRLPI